LLPIVIGLPSIFTRSSWQLTLFGVVGHFRPV
jgi:hypothetical protein